MKRIALTQGQSAIVDSSVVTDTTAVPDTFNVTGLEHSVRYRGTLIFGEPND